MLPAPLDALLDYTIAPGYSRIGYAARAAAWRDSDPPAGALQGRTVAITGPTSGIGKAAAQGAQRLGATVLLIGRNADKTERLRAELGGDTAVELADMSLLSSVRDLAQRLRGRPLHALVHNAGVMTERRSETPEGNEVTLATHVLGPHLLSRLLLDAPPARTIWVSSGGMYTQRLDTGDLQSTRGEFDGTTAYARTKRMQVVLAEEWARRTPAPGVGAQHASGMGGHARSDGGAADVPPADQADPAPARRGRRHHRVAGRRRRAGAQHRSLLARPPRAPDALPGAHARAAVRPRGPVGRL